MTETNNETVVKKKPNWAKWGLLITTFGLVVFIFGFGYGYFELAKVNIALVRMVNELETNDKANQTAIADLKNAVTNLAQDDQKFKAELAETEKSLTEASQAQKGNLNRWYVAEANYLIRLANDQLQLTHDTALATIYLQRANEVLQNINDPNLLEARQSLTSDIAQLESVKPADVTQLYLQLVALNNQIDQLPLPANPLQTENKVESVPTDLPWWKAGLHHTWQSLRQIVVVRQMSPTDKPLILPEEKQFLYQNLHAQIESALWAVMNRNQQVYEATMTRLLNWVELYFDKTATQTQSFVQSIQTLQKVNIAPPESVSLAKTMQLLDAYLAEEKSPEKAEDTNAEKTA